MTRATIIICFLTAALMFAGCRSTQVVATQGSETAEQQTTAPAEPAEPAATECAMTWSAMGMTVDVLMRTKHDSIIWVTARKVIELGRIKLTPDSVLAYVKPYHRHFAGTYDDLFEATGYNTTFYTLQQTIDEAFDQSATSIVLPINATKLGYNLEVTATIRRRDDKREPLSYPFAIPPSSQPIWNDPTK